MYHDIKGHGANMGPIWGRQDPGGPHVGPMNFAIWVNFRTTRVVLGFSGCHNGKSDVVIVS